MCELLALSSRLPTSVTLSLSTFAQHRGADDGWGAAFYDTGDVRLYKEPEVAAESEWLAFIQQRCLIGVAFHLSYPSCDTGHSLAAEYPTLFSRIGRPRSPFCPQWSV